MTYEFKSSSTVKVHKQVFIALAGTTGSGKTESAMRIARGIVGDAGKFCVIDTEHGRALNKQGRYEFDHLDMQPPYSPSNFLGAILAAVDAGYGAIVIDNFSHEWFGDGGCSDIQEKTLDRLTGGDDNKAARYTAIAWKDPKREHKKMMNRLVQLSMPLIFCLRAEPKIKFQKDSNGRMQVIDAGWQPIAEKMFAYEMLIYALLMPENPGVPDQLKELEPDLKAVFPAGKQIDERVGERLIAWAGISTPLFDQSAEAIATTVELGKKLNAAGDSIKWSGKTTAEYANEMFDVTGGLASLSTEQCLALVADLTERLESLTASPEADSERSAIAAR